MNPSVGDYVLVVFREETRNCGTARMFEIVERYSSDIFESLILGKQAFRDSLKIQFKKRDNWQTNKVVKALVNARQ